MKAMLRKRCVVCFFFSLPFQGLSLLQNPKVFLINVAFALKL